ncbi:hypothetical protein AAFN60_04590 [Roseibacillus persicicus]|uniref:hypothetical protein n=1 Tax=Roseibacillus persicicus TaxID=454148 RepID=UPI00398A9761
MKFSLAISLLLLALGVSSCGRYQSHLHESATWRAYRNGKSDELPAAEIVQGERLLAFEHIVGLPVPGGYNATLVAKDPELVRVEYVTVDRGSRTYVTGLQPGETRLYLVNGIAVGNQIHQGASAVDDQITKHTPTFPLVIKPSQTGS